jgi:transmembrane sensor
MKSNKSDQPENNRLQSIREMQKVFGIFADELYPHVPTKEETLKRAQQRRAKRNSVYAASGIILGLVMAAFIYNPCYQQQRFTTQLGQQQHYRLADGSTLRLNTNTQVLVQQKLRSREVELLQGEASFEVRHWPTWAKVFEPEFRVRAGTMKIRDIGTVFNVLKLSDHAAKVSVQHGAVAVSFANSTQAELIVRSGQSLQNYPPNRYQVLNDSDPFALIAWQSGAVVFNQTPLDQVIREFQRYADFKVQFAHQELKKIPINGRFNSANYQTFLAVLSPMAGLKLHKISDHEWMIAK